MPLAGNTSHNIEFSCFSFLGTSIHLTLEGFLMDRQKADEGNE